MGRRWRGRHTLLAVFTATYFATRVQPVVIGPLVPDITTALSTSEAVIGAAITGLWVAYALVQLPSGMVADRIGYRSVVIAALLIGGLGSLLMAGAPTALVFGLTAVVLGAGVGLYYNVGVLSLSERFAETGWAIGVHRIGAQVAGFSVPVVAVTVAAVAGWRAALLLGAVAMLPMVVLVAILVDPVDPPAGAGSPPGLLDRALVSGFFRRRQLVYLTVLAGIGEFVAVANMAFLPAFLVSYHGFDQALAGVLFSVYFLVVSLTHPIAGWVADRADPEAVVAVAMGVGAVTHGLLVVDGSTVSTAVLAASLGVAMGYNIPLQSALLDSLAAAEAGTWFGAFRTAYVLLGSLGGVVAGTVATRGGWAAAYALLAALFAVGVVLIVGHRLRYEPLGRVGATAGA